MDTREADRQTAVVEPKTPNGAVAGTVEPDEPLEERSGVRRRTFYILGGVVVLILILVFGIPWVAYATSHQGTDDARVDADVVAVTSKIPERIDRILVSANQPVRRGELLIVLDNKDELARLQQARAQFDLAMANQRTLTVQNQGGVQQAAGNIGSSQAQVPVAQAGVDQAAAQAQVARAQVPAAEQAYAKASADYARVSSLVSTGD